jgi:hypothetical protein
MSCPGNDLYRALLRQDTNDYRGPEHDEQAQYNQVRENRQENDGPARDRITGHEYLAWI